MDSTIGRPKVRKRPILITPQSRFEVQPRPGGGIRWRRQREVKQLMDDSPLGIFQHSRRRGAIHHNGLATHPARFADALDEYLVHLRAMGRSAATIEAYAREIELLGRFIGRNVRLPAISAGVLDAAVAAISGEPASRRVRRSGATLNRCRSTYRAFFRWAFETGRIAGNPAALLRLARAESAPTLPITLQESRLFLTAIRRSADPLRLRDEALFSVYALTGLRRAEALRLELADYNPGAKTLRVKDLKAGRPRMVPVARPLGLALEKFLASLESNSAGGPLFEGRLCGKPLTVRQAQTRFERWRNAAGLRRGITIHSFRAGFATTLHRASGDLVLVSRALGHRDLRPTLRYVESCPGILPRVIEKSFARLV